MNSLVGTTVEMTVKHSAQGASGGSYWVDYKADITITADKQIDVSVSDVYPKNADSRDVEAARKAINHGCMKVLNSTQFGARVSVTALKIHPVDFKPSKFSDWTAIDLQQHLDKLSNS